MKSIDQRPLPRIRFAQRPKNTIHIYVNTLPISAVLDTGSERTVISNILFERIKSGRAKPLRHQAFRSTMTAANQTIVECLGTVTVNFRMGGLVIPYDCRIVNNLTNDCIIGMDLLKELNAQIDLKHGVLE